MAIFMLMMMLTALIALDLAAARWGVDTSEAVDSAEWERRRTWRGNARR